QPDTGQIYLGVSGRPDSDRGAVQVDLTSVRLVDAGEDFDQRRFAGTVFTDQRSDLSAVKVELRVSECSGPTKGFGNVAETEDRSGRRVVHANAQNTCANWA